MSLPDGGESWVYYFSRIRDGENDTGDNIYSNYLQRFQLQMERKQKTGEEKCQLI